MKLFVVAKFQRGIYVVKARQDSPAGEVILKVAHPEYGLVKEIVRLFLATTKPTYLQVDGNAATLVGVQEHKE